MNYYALFLDSESYIEKCLALIKYIGNPQIKSLPHITLRLFRGSDERLSYIKTKKYTYLNIIEPGAFNLKKDSGPYVVFLKCESEELEEIDYRPDYPFSRLHITLYEGTDYEYAKELLSFLKQFSWHFKLTFDIPKHLTEQKLGAINTLSYNFSSVYKDILGEEELGDSVLSFSRDQKLQTIQTILFSLKNYIKNHQNYSEGIESLYTKQLTRDSKNFVDDRKSISDQLVDQLIIEGFPEIEKPVQDAIFVTPPEYAKDMACCALAAFGDDSKKILFGDSAIGTGALFIAIKRVVDTVNNEKESEYSFESAIGVDIDYSMAKEAFLRCNKRNLKVIYGDALSPNIDLGKMRNMMIVNPPYNRHEDIPKEYREQIQQLAEKQTGIHVSANSGLYVYHLLIMDKWLDDNGVAVWLLPSIVLQARYGYAVRKYLTENVTLTSLHIYNEEKLQFNNTLISTMIVVFKKEPPDESCEISVTFGDSVSNPTKSKKITIKELKEGIDNWRNTISNSQVNIEQKELSELDIRFSSLFDIKRGIATGANSFFVMRREDAQEKNIPEMALKPVLPKARYLKTQIVEATEDGYPDVEPQLVLIDCGLDEDEIKRQYPGFYNYLRKAYEPDINGKTIVDRHLVKARKPWYKQEQRESPLFLLTYMGRKKEELPTLYFILNKSNAVGLNTYLFLYPKPWLKAMLEKDDSLCEKLLSALNSSSKKVIEQQTRVYSGGLQKLEPNELKNLPISHLPEAIIEEYKASNHS